MKIVTIQSPQLYFILELRLPPLKVRKAQFSAHFQVYLPYLDKFKYEDSDKVPSMVIICA